MTLYEITEDITKESEETVTIKEASKRLNRTVGSLYGAAAEGRRINDRYYLRATDRTLSRNNQVPWTTTCIYSYWRSWVALGQRG